MTEAVCSIVQNMSEICLQQINISICSNPILFCDAIQKTFKQIWRGFSALQIGMRVKAWVVKVLLGYSKFCPHGMKSNLHHFPISLQFHLGSDVVRIFWFPNGDGQDK